MFIQKAKGNVKKGADVELGHKTLIVGPNGSGKSTIVNIVELALTNRAGDIAGRVDIAREADVMSLSTNGAAELEAVVTFDDGMVAAYRTSGSTAKAKKATGDKPSCAQHEDVLPIRTLREALLGSPQTARKFLLGKVGGNTTISDIEELIPEPLRAHFKECMPANVSIADGLVAAVEYAAKQARDHTAAAKTAREAGKLVSGGRGAPPSDADLKAAKQKLDAARTAHQEAVARERAAEQLAAAEAAVQKIDQESMQIVSELTAATKKLDGTPVPKALHPSIPAILTTMVESHAEGECLCCGGKAPEKSSIEDVTAAIAATEHAASSYNTAKSAVVALEARAKAVLEILDATEAKRDALKLKLGETGIDSETAANTVEHLEKDYLNLRAARDAWASVQKAESTALDADRQALEWKGLKESLEGAMALTLDKSLSAFIESVQAHLPAADKFDLKMRDGEREVVQFGLVRDGKLHTALSGAEWARVMAAMSSACVPAGRYACVIPEERAFDPGTLKDVMAALTDCPHQVILTSPVKPRSIPKGWTVIERGE